jgi:hypothetical protein
MARLLCALNSSHIVAIAIPVSNESINGRLEEDFVLPLSRSVVVSFLSQLFQAEKRTRGWLRRR